MKNKLTKSLAPFVIFGIALAILAGWAFLQLKFDWDFLILGEILVVFLFFWLIIEAAAQANPDQVTSPLHKFLAKYPSRRDQVVVAMANVAALIVLVVMSRLSMNPFWVIGLSVVVAFVVYYGICLLFGTRELQDLVVPKFIRQMVASKKSVDE